MKKFIVIFLLVFLVMFTAFIKNSTKRIDDEIFVKKENIQSLKKDFSNIKLEYDYLSSAERLLEFKNLYFDNELIKKNFQDIRIINKNFNKLQIEKLKLFHEK